MSEGNGWLISVKRICYFKFKHHLNSLRVFGVIYLSCGFLSIPDTGKHNSDAHIHVLLGYVH